jgi:hypothetical protein
MNVQHLVEIGKRYGRDGLLLLTIILVGVGGYYIGKNEAPQEGGGMVVRAERVDTLASAGEGLKDMTVVASSRGSKYYFAACAGAKSISPKNRVTFTSPEEAERRGYTQAAGCEP